MTARNSLAKALSTWFGCGYVPVAPGTAGSLAALGIAFLLVEYGHWKPVWLLALAAALVAPAIWAAGVIASSVRQEDPRLVVVDEVLGQWIAVAGATEVNWKAWLGAFVLFRLFDILKPPPVRQLEHLPSGYGIVTDDLMAGLYAALVLFLGGSLHLY
jgi:phosphatidylglycerophosphatase A